MNTRMGPHPTRPWIRPSMALLAVFCLLGVYSLAQAQSPLEQQRQKLRAPPAVTPVLRGTVVSVRGGIILTSITTADARAAGITDDTALRLSLAGSAFDARFMSPTSYARVVNDPAARKALDVDVVCTLDSNGTLMVVGLGGGLPEGFGILPGAPVTVGKR